MPDHQPDEQPFAVLNVFSDEFLLELAIELARENRLPLDEVHALLRMAAREPVKLFTRLEEGPYPLWESLKLLIEARLNPPRES